MRRKSVLDVAKYNPYRVAVFSRIKATSLFGSTPYVFDFANEQTGNTINFTDFPLVTLGVNDVDNSKARVIQNTGAEFDAYISSGEKLKGNVFNLLGQRIAPIQFQNYGKSFSNWWMWIYWK